jgi:hypothetical protein
MWNVAHKSPADYIYIIYIMWDVVHEHRAELEEKFATTFAVLTTMWDVVRKLLRECSHNKPPEVATNVVSCPESIA